MIIALLVLVALVSLLIWSALAFDTHCESRFGISIFETGRVLVNFAGWALVVAGIVSGIGGAPLAIIGAVILVAQLVRLIANTSLVHGVFAFGFLCAVTLAVVFVIALAVSAATDTRSRRVIVID